MGWCWMSRAGQESRSSPLPETRTRASRARHPRAWLIGTTPTYIQMATPVRAGSYPLAESRRTIRVGGLPAERPSRRETAQIWMCRRRQTTDSSSIYAPGHNLKLADIRSYDSYRTDPTTKSGTSFSAAVVSGIAARLLQTNPSLTAVDVLNYITATATHAPFDIDPDPQSYNPMIAYRGWQFVCTPEFP